MRVAVIGAGPAGLTAAFTLAKAAHDVDVFESGSDVGGMARSLSLWGQTVDVGPHRFFSSDRRVNSLWLELVGRDYAMVDRKTRIYYKGKFFDYPLDALDVLSKLGLSEALRCGLSYVGQKLAPETSPASFESWVTNRFGRRLYEIFFKSYSEKLWGIPCSELDADFAAQRIKRFSLGAAVSNAIWPSSRARHRTLVDQFAYPLEGTGMVYRRMASRLKDLGGRVHLNTPVDRVVLKGNRLTGLTVSTGELQTVDAVISTMPLTQLVTRLEDAPTEVSQAAGKLRFRNTIIVYLEILADQLFEDNWIYIQDSNVRTGRITNFRNWVPQLYGAARSTILALEYWCNGEDAIWTESDRALINLATEELITTGIIERPGIVARGMVYRIPKCYPIYRLGYRDALAPIQEYLSGVQGLQVIGRYGAFKYNNQDHSILMGLLAADNILSSSDHDLWSVNCDYDGYQEQSLITETGLADQCNCNRPQGDVDGRDIAHQELLRYK